ncbi:hypothetical protein BSZ36_17875 [Rubricoccus marinus]|uniref:ASPIC/UnbV domain-containing protein n=2 Tax=Rubricoccus marinus TaxID=716817 RepID=A0A259TUR6_9BACT|nr:hypothetical protein BSZ36_17875 [Rubricoccus marinus]
MRRTLLFVALVLLARGATGQGFEYRTFLSGLGSVTGANGVAVADYDRDGDLDVYIVVREAYDAANTTTWSRLFANRGDGTFVDQTRASGVAGSAGVGLPNTAGNGAKLGAAWGDYDGDGWPDLYLTHAGPNQLYRNNGNGTFTDVTATAGVAGGATQLSTSALWFDTDGDGDLDLHVGVWEDYPGDGAPRDLANPYFVNNGDGTFTEAGAARGLGDVGKTYTTLPVDVDHDGDVDLYDANDFGANRLFLNDGTGTFDEATAAFGLENTGEGMGLALGDLDGDGREDIFLTNRADSPVQTNALFVAQEAGGYAGQAEAAGVAETGWGWGAEFFDLENDGDQDLFVANGYFASDTPNALFENTGTFPLADIAPDLSVDDLHPARGLVIFDADGDGRLDVLIANVSRAPHFYANRASGGAWLSIALEGDVPNVDALGAVVEVEAGGQRWVRSHHGAQFLGQSLAPVHVGLGEAEIVDRLVVRWPGGGEEAVTQLRTNQRVRIRQGYGLLEGETVASGEAPEAGTGLRIVNASPNPSAGSVSFVVSIPAGLSADFTITDLLGRQIHTSTSVGRGSGVVTWDGRDARGMLVAAGAYVASLSTAGFRPSSIQIIRSSN